MAEGEQASGAHEPSMEERWEDPKNYRARFEEMATAFHKGEFTRRNEDGSRTTIVSYETSFDPTDRIQRNWLAEFRIRAAGAGLREAFSPLVLPQQVFYSPDAPSKPAHLRNPDVIVQLGYEMPATTPDPRLEK